MARGKKHTPEQIVSLNGTPEELDYCSLTLGSWGVQGTPAAANLPSGRDGVAGWMDKSGNLWIFGGLAWIKGGAFTADLNDLWVYKPVAPASTPSFELVAPPNPIGINETAGATTTGTTTINVVVADGFEAPVSLTAAAIQITSVPGITGSLSPSTITGAGSSQLTVSVNGAAGPIGSDVPLIITGTSGSLSQSTQVIVVVTGGGQVPAPTFSVPAGTYAPQTVTLIDCDRD